ncbi:glucosaminidase domain-containing protein [Enterococcus pallens]|uniref:N-acetylmuramoyl-L-alanine amidase n=1 Tax=Enterococcus pallens ATCC BAA-351 TaxID=1158607 RepID=R2SDT2_9ENTE|nr:glucosaminidase domain-containing protein [Enterococcus pallens]EOH86309.1 N-acetylmuramoyl-L-alanine amidase [Enterococcus pallens ATCC BAA-351]EOU09470.1 N-acetylmuramoyl-L-alanine amidase [Enterococcus pallens ATCC BAA-351]OJG77534.1 N-acetylmuramoyl-L-alanine amidase [Enterococcus pallens]
MKKFSRIASALFLSVQAFLATPLNVFADETSPQSTAEQVQQSKEESETATTTESSTATSSESSTVPSSESSTTASSESSTVPSSESTKPSESTVPSQSEVPKAEEPQKESVQQPATPVNPDQPIAEQPKQEVVQNQEAAQQKPAIDQQATAELAEFIPSASVTEDGTLHFEKDESVDSFIRKIGEPARKIGKEYDLYASVMIAQAILESASGQSQLAQAPNYNLFGIKGTHNGKSVSMVTQEDFGNGNLYATQAGFRVYENYEDSLTDYAKLIKEGISGNSTFYSGVWKSNAKTYQEATKFLTGRYATDTQYNKKLNGLIETYDLTEYDKEVQGPMISSEGYKVPLNNYTISSPFGMRGGEFHRGLDMAAAQGEPIHAIKAGKVLKAEYHYSWGNYVLLQHDDGSTALYAHQQQYTVKSGETVSQGQTIGYVGSTGNSTGSHLHLEVCRDSSLSQSMLIDPQSVLFGN